MTPSAHVLDWRRYKARATEYADAFPQDPSWELVFLFYAALHLVDAYLATKGERFVSANHGDRKQKIKSCPELRANFVAAYVGLYDLSVDVRYQPGYRATLANRELALKHLKTIESFLTGKLRQAVPEAFE